MVARAAWARIAVLAVVGCGDAPVPVPGSSSLAPDEPTSCQPGERDLGDGGCLAAGMQANGCPAGRALGERGECLRPGVPEHACGSGFVGRADGCTPVLPESPCPAGRMAIPGETRCREVAPCQAGRWGGIPTDGDVEWVDGGAEEHGPGTQAAPWATIAEAIEAASDGATIAVADGVYLEDVVVSTKRVRIRGHCPRMVSIVGSVAGRAAVTFESAAGGSELRGVGVTGPLGGVLVAGVDEVHVSEAWIHDTGGAGVAVEGGAVGARLSASLVEAATGHGVRLVGSAGSVEESVLRDTASLNGMLGWGLSVEAHLETGARGALLLRRSVLDGNRDVGAVVMGSDATFEESVVTATRGQELDGFYGWGVWVTGAIGTPRYQRSSLTMNACVVSHNLDTGVQIEGSDASIDATTIADTQLGPAQLSGWGLASWDRSVHEPDVVVRRSRITTSRDVGVLLAAGRATIESTLVDGTLPTQGGLYGWGVLVQPPDEAARRTTATLRSSEVRDSHEASVVVLGADALIEGALVTATRPSDADGLFGEGIAVQADVESLSPAGVRILSSVVSDSHSVGVSIIDSSVEIEGTVVRTTLGQAADGLYGDGLSVVTDGFPTEVALLGSVVSGSERAGLSAFGSTARIGSTAFECNAIDLDGEPAAGASYDMRDLGGNRCGCQGSTRPCKVVSANLTAPEPLPPPGEQ